MQCFEDAAYFKQMKLTPQTMVKLKKDGLAVFPNLTVARLDAPNLALPFISLAVVDLSVLVARPLRGDDFIGICHGLRRAPPMLGNVSSLRIDGDDHLESFYRPLSRFCLSLPRLRKIVLAPSALSGALLSGLSRIASLVSIRIAECGRDRSGRHVYEAGAAIGLPVPDFIENSFPCLREMAFISDSPLATLELLVSPHFPCRHLEALWIRWPTGSWFSPDEVEELLMAMSALCISLRSLTLRFAPCVDYSLERDDPEDRLEFRHIRPFLNFPELRVFALDHSLPLCLTESDFALIGPGAHNFIELWLNPYPSIMSMRSKYWIEGVPDITCLRYFAEHCHFLSRLGLLVDARDPGALIEGTVPFISLTELCVGCSLITELEEYDITIVEGWRTLSLFIYHLLPRSAVLSTVSVQSDEEVEQLVCSRMRAMGGMEEEMSMYEQSSHAWRSVFGMILFIRENIGELNL